VSAFEQVPATLPFQAAMEARDLAAVLDTFAPDATLRSPFTARLAFAGREQIAAVLEVILGVFKDLRYTDDVRSPGTVFLAGEARIGGKQIEWVDRLQLDPDGSIRELTVFFRPLPATTVALRVIGAGLSRRRSQTRAALVSSLTRPLGFMAETGDRVGVRLVRSAL
jgi:hypothetical protein